MADFKHVFGNKAQQMQCAAVKVFLLPTRLSALTLHRSRQGDTGCDLLAVAMMSSGGRQMTWIVYRLCSRICVGLQIRCRNRRISCHELTPLATPGTLSERKMDCRHFVARSEVRACSTSGTAYGHDSLNHPALLNVQLGLPQAVYDDNSTVAMLGRPDWWSLKRV